MTHRRLPISELLPWLIFIGVLAMIVALSGCKAPPVDPPQVRPQPKVEFAPPTTVPSVTPLAKNVSDASAAMETTTQAHADRIGGMSQEQRDALKAEYDVIITEARQIAAENRALTATTILALNKAVENDARVIDLTGQVVDARSRVKGWETLWDGHLIEDWKVQEKWKEALSESVQREYAKDRATARLVGLIMCMFSLVPLLFGIFLISTSPQKIMAVSSLGGGVLLLSMGMAVIFKTEIFSGGGLYVAGGIGLLTLAPGIWGLIREARTATKQMKAAQADATAKERIAQSLTGGVEAMKQTGIIAEKDWNAAKGLIQAQAAVVMPDGDVQPLTDFVASNTP